MMKRITEKNIRMILSLFLGGVFLLHYTSISAWAEPEVTGEISPTIEVEASNSDAEVLPHFITPMLSHSPHTIQTLNFMLHVNHLFHDPDGFLLSMGAPEEDYLQWRITNREEAPWGDYQQYMLYRGGNLLESYSTVEEAIRGSQNSSNAYIIDKKNLQLVWANFNRPLYFDETTNQGNLYLVNRDFPIPSSYVPKDLVNLNNHKANYLRTSREITMESVTLQPMRQMLQDMYHAGHRSAVSVSGYRSYQYQTNLFNRRVNNLKGSLGLEAAEKEVAKGTAYPGASEHQTGLAIDFVAGGGSLSSRFATTNEGKWLGNNSWKYGFILRYQEDKTDITGIMYEPWHFRYVGSPHAEIMVVNNWALEEYLMALEEQEVLPFTDYNGINYKIYYFQSLDCLKLIDFLYETSNIKDISGDGKGGIVVTVEML